MARPGWDKANSCMEAILMVILGQGSINLGGMVTSWDTVMVSMME
jgi:hypothetical protein